ncbi:hypothetical protein DFH09DRAFT_985712, partial [Mycena vulgaris]
MAYFPHTSQSPVPLDNESDLSTSAKGATETETDGANALEPRIATANERCIDATRDLGKTNGEQTQSLTTMLERVNTALENLKQQPQSTDKTTAFWTAYQKLADEFDEELQKKYGNNLDTSLIFAGLFSAVSSAFIIQIQPELQPDPNPSTQINLLRLLVQNITGAAVPGTQMPEDPGPTAIIVVAQSLLYFSLFCTLLAALLAVLGKQW